MAWGPPKTPKQGTARSRAAYKEGRRGLGAAPYDHVDQEDLPDEAEEYDYSDPDEGSPWITPDRTEAMCAMVRKSVPVPVAAAAIGFTNDIWSSWMNTGREHKKQHKKPGFGVNESPYVYFLNKLDQARAQAEAERTMAIHNAAAHDWKAADTLNTKIAPKRWHVASKIEIEAQMGNGKVDITSLPTATLLAMAKGQTAEAPLALPAGSEPVDGEIEE